MKIEDLKVLVGLMPQHVVDSYWKDILGDGTALQEYEEDDDPEPIFDEIYDYC